MTEAVALVNMSAVRLVECRESDAVSNAGRWSLAGQLALTDPVGDPERPSRWIRRLAH